MSSESSPSPPDGTSPSFDEAQLPRGRCRYILMVPELRGLRCACVNFTRARSMPSATCDCGHLACFHVKDDVDVVEKHEFNKLKQRLEVVEEQLDIERHGSLASVISQLVGRGEGAPKGEEERENEIRGIYHTISRIWNSIDKLERRGDAVTEISRIYDARLKAVEAQPRPLAYQSRERADSAGRPQNIHGNPGAIQQSEYAKGPEAMELAIPSPSPAHNHRHQHHHQQTPAGREAAGGLVLSTASTRTHLTESSPFATRSLHPAGPEPWTVHISLLPDPSLPFPFERDTNAYKRCLSRGLHRMVVVGGPDADAFSAIVTNAFGHLLQGRPWMPLQARVCAAEQLSGFLMLRQLDPKLQDCRFDHEFLQKHCAVSDPKGKIESLYIATRTGILPWSTLRNAPVYIAGLEASWAHDPLLDNQGQGAENRGRVITNTNSGGRIEPGS
ncbi:uncharacterized protein DNG_01895 [Cephalotrichum gorgonifer]|uniref:Uncharacterized protein n=1 Tax=Cephalotrichum gorgonifer TaxID=2041049 RepID=A0AAE8MSG0_9PEZI|nr:uncharacterized protein DNG_01895 [Cephalotrichum gorgonifer]